LGEVAEGFLEVEEPVPDEAPAVVGWRVVWVLIDNAIEVFKCLLQLVSSNFLSDCSEMVNGRDVLRLELYCLAVVLFSL
jgi:hypothetical protein